MKNEKNKLIPISVIGSSNTDEKTLETAFKVGQLIASKRGIVICGGLGGIMKSVCKGAKSANGITLGILPGDDPNDSNDWIDIKIPTGIGYARNVLVVKASRVSIAIAGAFGTLSEIGHALAENKQVIGLGTWKLDKNHLPNNTDIIHVESPEKAVELAFKFALRQNRTIEE